MPCPAFEINNNDDDGGEMSSGSCKPSWLYRQLESESEDEVLLLDCRAPNDYNASHIRGAIHVAIPTLMLRRLKKGNIAISSVISGNEGKEKFSRKCKTETLVIYDENTADVNLNSTSVVSLLMRRLREDGCRVTLLEGGFEAYEQQYPHHCVNFKEANSEDSAILGLRNLQITDSEETIDSGEPTPNDRSSDPFPVEVLPYLFLGCAKNSSDLECLYKNGIKYILNVTPNVPNTFENDRTFRYMQIPISDHWSQNLSSFFPQAIAFIDEARKNKCGVLVHCLAGISRSVTVTVAYLMSSLSLSLNDAYDFVKRCKHNISPNFNFMGQLLDFERTLQNSGSPFECTCKDSPCHCLVTKTYFSSPMATSSTSSSPSPLPEISPSPR